jgi:excisionase family DNA binding protein
MVMVTTEPRFYTVEEVAQLLRVSARTVYRLVERGELRALRVGDLYRISQENLDSYLRGERPE